MTELKFVEWQKAYEDAMLELNSSKLAERISVAEAAIFLRLQTLANDPDGEIERQTIEGALEALRIVKRDKLAFPDWNDGNYAGNNGSDIAKK